MQLLLFTPFFLYQAFAYSSPLWDGKGANGADLEKRSTILPDAIPTTIVKLKRDGAATVTASSSGVQIANPFSISASLSSSSGQQIANPFSSVPASSSFSGSIANPFIFSLSSSATQPTGTHHHHHTVVTTPSAASPTGGTGPINSTTPAAAQSTSSHGGANAAQPVPLVGILLLGLLGL